jgi:hypothetical protein
MDQRAPRRPFVVRSLFLLALPAALAVAVVALFRARPEPAPAREAGAASDEVAQLRGELQLLRRQMQVMSQQQAAAANGAPAATATAPAASSTAPLVPPITEEEASARDRRRFEGLARKLAAEPVDRQWAPATERLIADTLNKPAFKGTKLLDAACHSTMCRFEVAHDSQADGRRFASTLPTRLPSMPSGSMRHAEGNDRKTIVYVAREGHRVPRDDAQ